jgi:hypothetical protein
VLGLVTLLLLPLVAFGGRNPTLAVTFGVISLAYAYIASPRPLMPLDRNLCLLVVAILIQLIPFPSVIHHVLSPQASAAQTSLSLLPANKRRSN